MKNKLQYFFFFLLAFLVGCGKNDTKYFEDAEKNGLSIFSNKGNNILTAYVNGTAWKTKDRITDGYTYRTDYEITIEKQKTNTQRDTMIFTWNGPNDNNNNYKIIRLHIAVDSSLTYKDFNTNFNGKRIIMDSSINGYFSTNLNNTVPNLKGNGVILFQFATIDINSTQQTFNNMAGLLSAKIGTNVITEGRFDHALNGLPINF